MDKVTVLFYGSALKHTGGQRFYEATESTSIRLLIDELGRHYGAAFKDFLQNREECFFLINGQGLMQTGGLDSGLNPGDNVDILPHAEAG